MTRLDDELYRVGPIQLATFGRGWRIVHASATGVTRVLPLPTVERLVRCQTFKPLSAHARERLAEWVTARRTQQSRVSIVGAFLAEALVSLLRRSRSPLAESTEVHLLEETLRALAGEGFLVGRTDTRRRLRADEAASGSGRIEAIAIPTADRPRELARCIESYAANQAAFGRRSRLIVSDDAREDAARRRTRAVVETTEGRFGIESRHLTRRDRQRFAERLAREIEAPPETLAFGLLGDPRLVHSTGANRNAILLALPGQRLLSVDDDTVCRLGPARPPGETAGCALESRLDPRDHRFFPDREHALADWPAASEDLLSLHESLLGRSIQRVALDCGPDDAVLLDEADDAVIEDVVRQRGRVLLTTTGVAGQSGVRWPWRLLEMERPWARQLLASEELYRATLRSPEVRAVVSRTTLGNRSLLASTFFGFDSSVLLPPFLPVLRSQDVLFTRVLRRCHDDAYLGHLPFTLVHDPLDDRSLPAHVLWQHPGIELAYVLADLVDHARISAWGEPAARMVRLGTHLSRLASLPARDFVERVSKTCLERQAGRIVRLQRRIDALRDAPGFWVTDVERHVSELRRVVSGSLPPPQDVPGPPEQAWRLTQDLVRLYGGLLSVWPRVFEASHRLAAREKGLLSVD